MFVCAYALWLMCGDSFPSTTIMRLSFDIFSRHLWESEGYNVWSHFWTDYAVLLVDVPIFIPIPYCFCHSDFVVHFEVKCCDTFSMALSDQTSLGYFTIFCDSICILE